jgi:hypothetical protein
VPEAPDDRQVEDFFRRKRKPTHSKDALVWFRFYVYTFVHSLVPFFTFIPVPTSHCVFLPFNLLLRTLVQTHCIGKGKRWILIDTFSSVRQLLRYCFDNRNAGENHIVRLGIQVKSKAIPVTGLGDL